MVYQHGSYDALERQSCRCYALGKESTANYLRSLGELTDTYRTFKTAG